MQVQTGPNTKVFFYIQYDPALRNVSMLVELAGVAKKKKNAPMSMLLVLQHFTWQ